MCVQWADACGPIHFHFIEKMTTQCANLDKAWGNLNSNWQYKFKTLYKTLWGSVSQPPRSVQLAGPNIIQNRTIYF